MTNKGIPVRVEIAARGHDLIKRQANETAYAAAIAYATAEGTANGRAAASWYFDGNTSDATRAVVLRGIEDGDPAVLDTFPAPDLSGQWADSLTGPQLVADALAAGMAGNSGAYDPAGEWHDDIYDAYETAYSEAVEDAIGEAARNV